MVMFETVAEMGDRFSLAVCSAPPADRPDTMPLCHLVDMHTYRGVGHLGPSLGGKTFAARFKLIFDRVTGSNPRLKRCESPSFEADKLVEQTRFAQRLILRFALKVPATPLSAPPGGAAAAVLTLRIDSGVLAAAVGPIAVKVKAADGKTRELLVMLGVRCAEDEVVMLKPARQTRDLFGSLTDAEREQAVAAARSKPHPARSPMLEPDVKHEATFADGCWRLNGRKWEEVVAAGRTLTVPAVERPGWVALEGAGRLGAALASDDAVEEALRSSAAEGGAVPGAQELVEGLVAGCSDSVGLRAVSMLRQQVVFACSCPAAATTSPHPLPLIDRAVNACSCLLESPAAHRTMRCMQYAKVALPTPALSGGIGSDQLAACSGDWDVYRLLCLVSRLAPGALRPATPPNFTVPDASLLRVVERWMLNALRRGPMLRQRSGGLAAELAVQESNEWVGHKYWTGMAAAATRLMEHQRAAVAAMIQRDTEADTGHFLIMDTGVGKTVTSLCYLYRWLCSPAGCGCRRIIWVTPKGTVENLVKQLKGKWKAPVWNVPRVSTGKKAVAGLQLRDYHVNVIHADHLRTAIDAGLAVLGPSSAICFDEVDEM